MTNPLLVLNLSNTLTTQGIKTVEPHRMRLLTLQLRRTRCAFTLRTVLDRSLRIFHAAANPLSNRRFFIIVEHNNETGRNFLD